MTPTGRASVGRKLSSPAKAPRKEGAVFKSIPWDIWAAAAIAGTIALAMMFEPGPALFIVGYIFMCAYILVETINGAQS